MDANSESNKAGAEAAGQGAVAAGLPNVESPSLAPGQGESAAAKADAAVTHKVMTAVALYKGDRPDEELDTGRTNWSPAKIWSSLQIPPLTAAVVLTLCVGALAGAVGMFGVGQLTAPSNSIQAQVTGTSKDAIAKLSADVAVLKAAQDTSARTVANQLARFGERVDRTERAQAEPAARMAKISEALDRLERRVPVAALPPATVPAAPAPMAAATSIHPMNQAEVTGAIPSPRPDTAGSAKDISRLPIIQGWVLQKVVDGTAIIRSREGMIEVGVGAGLPGGGRVESIRRQDGRWIVVTSRGVVLTR